MKHKAPWMAVIVFTAFSTGAIAVDNDSSRATRNAIEEGLPGPVADDPRLSSNDTQAPDSSRSSSAETQASDSRVTNSDESRAPGHTSSSVHRAALASSFAQADRDGKGVLDPAEANAAGINFSSANQDDDGVISTREYNFAIEQMGSEARP